tara:strand:- start:14723 stop:15733 length:1011 start_codon:yes stop_codon:yes gene_type:complete
MRLTTQLIERNAQQFSDYKNLLVVGPPADDDLSFLCPQKVLTLDYRVYKSLLSGLADDIEYSLSHQADLVYDGAVVFLPKSKGELDLLLAYIAPMLQRDADIYLVGEKKGGIASAAKKLQDFGEDASKLDSAKHCQLWHVSLGVEAKLFDIDQWIKTIEFDFKGVLIKIAAIPGVFSFAELDEGTALLMDNMFNKLDGRILDFGCGCGVLGVYAKIINPGINLEMVDINLLALICAAKTAELNGIEAKIYPSDGWQDVAGRVNGVVTNPPFHSGIATEYQTTEYFIHKAKDKMAKYAPLLLVANTFLKYAAIIEKTFGRCDVLAETRKFRVYKSFR